jgi:hypothetical protein
MTSNVRADEHSTVRDCCWMQLSMNLNQFARSLSALHDMDQCVDFHRYPAQNTWNTSDVPVVPEPTFTTLNNGAGRAATASNGRNRSCRAVRAAAAGGAKARAQRLLLFTGGANAAADDDAAAAAKANAA